MATSISKLRSEICLWHITRKRSSLGPSFPQQSPAYLRETYWLTLPPFYNISHPTHLLHVGSSEVSEKMLNFCQRECAAHLSHFRRIPEGTWYTLAPPLLPASRVQKPYVADLTKGLYQKASEEIMFEALDLWSILPTLEGQDSGRIPWDHLGWLSPDLDVHIKTQLGWHFLPNCAWYTTDSREGLDFLEPF